MAKKLSMLTSIVLGAAGGAAAAVFLATETGKKVKGKVTNFVKDYQENHEEINADLVNKARDLKDQAVEKYEDVKGQLDSGELTVDDLFQTGKEKVQQIRDQSLEKFDQLKEKVAERPVENAIEETSVVIEDIEIDMK